MTDCPAADFSRFFFVFLSPSPPFSILPLFLTLTKCTHKMWSLYQHIPSLPLFSTHLHLSYKNVHPSLPPFLPPSLSLSLQMRSK